MKIYYLAIFCTLLFCACNKEKTPFDKAQKDNNGSATAIINGKPFISTVTNGDAGSYSGRYVFSLTCQVYDKSGFQRQQFLITNVDLNKATQRVRADLFYDTSMHNYRYTDSCFSSFGLMNDDETGDYYTINDSLTNNIITINSYNKSSGKVEGSFNLTMYRKGIESQPAETDLGDTLHITQGKFEVTIK